MAPTDRATKSASATNTGAATDKALVAAVTGKRIHIKKLVFTSSAATDLTIESDGTSSDTQIIKLLGVTAVVLEGFEFLKTLVGEALIYTTTAGNSEVYVEYNEG